MALWPTGIALGVIEDLRQRKMGATEQVHSVRERELLSSTLMLQASNYDLYTYTD